MLREIEVANVRRRDVTVADLDSCGVTTLKVSASKKDIVGKTLPRHHGCACPSLLCPGAAMRRLLRQVGPAEAGHLVRANDGQVVTKVQVVQEIQALARVLGANSGRYTGHTLRVTGAQQMALAGVTEEKSRMFGRWVANERLGYARESLLTAAKAHGKHGTWQRQA